MRTGEGESVPAGRIPGVGRKWRRKGAALAWPVCGDGSGVHPWPVFQGALLKESVENSYLTIGGLQIVTTHSPHPLPPGKLSCDALEPQFQPGQAAAAVLMGHS